ncbi:hypothetical protein Aduo_006097 [Ancylostoma duodenale]
MNGLTEFHLSISILKPAIVFVTGSWLTPIAGDDELLSGLPYSVIRKERVSKKGRGVCALIHSDLQDEKLSSIELVVSGAIASDLFRQMSQTHRFVLVYRLPNQHTSQENNPSFLSNDLSSSPWHLTIFGDLNVPGRVTKLSIGRNS